MRARRVVAVVFAANGLLFGSWVPRIPDISADLALTPGQLGFALLAPAVGSLLSMPLAGAASSRYGSAWATRVTLAAFCLVPFLIGLAPNLALLWTSLFVWGIGFGGLDVSMNAQGVTVERVRGRPTLSSLHAAFSFGGLLGAVLGSAGAAVAVPVATQLAVTGVLLLAVVLPLTRWLLPDPATGGTPGPLFARPSGRLLILGAAAFSALVCEGAAADWSAVYLRADLGSSPGLAGAGFVAFSVTMTVGRLMGDRLTGRWGPSSTLGVLAAVGCLGVAAGLVVATPAAAVLGFLAGPALIGGLAELSSLPAALWVLPVLTAAAGLLGRAGTLSRTAGLAGRAVPASQPLCQSVEVGSRSRQRRRTPTGRAGL